MKQSLLLIHGFPLDGSFWQEQLEGLSSIAEVLAPDLRGFGADRREVPSAMSMEAYADDLRALLDAHGLERAVLCGLSMGGYVAMAFADRWPERVQGLILCNTRSTADTEEGKAAREQTASDALEKGAAVIARAMIPKVLSERTRREQAQAAARVEAIMAGQRPEAIAAASRGMALRPDRTRVLRELNKPALIVTGSDDALMPLPTSEAMRAALPDSRMVVIEGAAHLSPVEAPERFNAEVSMFLKRIA
ncbi:MAG: alpha/beta fold hydrolase [Flavobacteriales bacterium]|jgi:pimeloyl-ACP methyl ester carboxylesterase|nr:alpha/beta fold hydrolase [Flavobacteriales bacterium]